MVPEVGLEPLAPLQTSEPVQTIAEDTTTSADAPPDVADPADTVEGQLGDSDPDDEGTR